MKKYIQENYRVIAIPITGFFSKREPTKKECEELAKAIERHCDTDRVDIDWDTKCVCEFCGEIWDTEEEEMPFCCNKAQEEYEKLRDESLNSAKDEPILKEPLNDKKQKI